jgi:molybdate transport system substrate-binding protein
MLPGALVQFDRLKPRDWLLVGATAALVSLTAIFVIGSSRSEQGKHITVLAASSMQNALDDINAAFTKSTGVKVIAGYAASSVLIKQIAQGAAADVFASAALEWMDFGSKRKLIRDDTRVNLLGNQLVLIAPKDSKLDSVVIGTNFDLANLVEDGSIATGEVGEVPVGMYAKQALEKFGAWQAAAPKLVMTRHVRAALTLVAVGEARLGIVYRTDAKGSPDVKIIGTFPADSHSAIVYRVAATVTAKPEGVGYLAYLCSMTAKVIFEQNGFRFLIQPTS